MGLLRMRKAWVLAVACVLAMCTGLPAWANLKLIAYHWSGADLVDNKAVYDVPYFRELYLALEAWGTAPTDEQLQAKGTLTIQGGHYGFTKDGTSEEIVDGTPKTFPLLPYQEYMQPGKQYIGYFAADDNGKELKYTHGADEGLQGITLSWNLLGEEYQGRFPSLRTTEQQVGEYVPYIELERSGSSITGAKWRFATLESLSIPLSLPFQTNIRVEIIDTSNQEVFRTSWDRYPAGETLSGNVALPTPLDESEFSHIVLRFRDVDSDGGYSFPYRWAFFPRTPSDEGLTDLKVLQPITLKTGESSEFFVLPFAAGYSLPKNEPNVILGDKTVVSTHIESELSGGTNRTKFQVKGLRSGTTTLSFRYVKTHSVGDSTPRISMRYSTTPIQVTVTDAGGDVPAPTPAPTPDLTPAPTPSPNPILPDPDLKHGIPSGSGCDAGFAGLALLAAGTLILTRKR